MSCSDLQIEASCFDLNNSCVSTCENKVDSDCRNAGMYGYVRDCQVSRLAYPQVNEGWNLGSSSSPKHSISVNGIVIICILLFFVLFGFHIFRNRK